MYFKHLFISASADKAENTLIYKCHNINKSFNEQKLIILENNTKGLSEVYNEILFKYKNEYDYIHFVHDDIFIYDDISVIDNMFFNYNYDIIGVAGSGRVHIKHPALWHIMGSEKMFGAVEHKPKDIKDQYITKFGSSIGDVIVLDGVYLCVKTESINEWKFNENFKFHHYDIASCIDAFKMKLKLGVLPIHIRHEPVLYDPTQNNDWIESNKKFLELYAK